MLCPVEIADSTSPLSLGMDFLSASQFSSLFPCFNPFLSYNADPLMVMVAGSFIMWLLPLLVGVIPLVAAQETQSQDTTTTQGTGTGTASIGPGSIILLHGTTATASVDATGEPPVPTGSYITYSTTMTISNSSNAIYTTTAVGNMTLNSTASNNTASTTTNPITRLVGGSGATGNSSSTSSAASTSTPVINTQPCNGYPEFCSRSYSNITMVAAHNSPFVRPGNAASNQALDVTTQLDDGIRMCMSSPM